MFSYPVCRACPVNLPPAACRVDGLYAALKRQTLEVVTSKVRRLYLPAIAYASSA